VGQFLGKMRGEVDVIGNESYNAKNCNLSANFCRTHYDSSLS